MFPLSLFWLTLLRQIDSKGIQLVDFINSDGHLFFSCNIFSGPDGKLPIYSSIRKVGVEQPIIEAQLVNATTMEEANGGELIKLSWQKDLMLVTKNYGIGWNWFLTECGIAAIEGYLSITFSTEYEIFFIHGGTYECKTIFPDEEYKSEIYFGCML